MAGLSDLALSLPFTTRGAGLGDIDPDLKLGLGPYEHSRHRI